VRSPGRTVRLLLAGAVLAGPLTLTAAPATARSCAEPSADLAGASDLVFAGVVSDRRTSGDDPVVVVRVDRVFEGEVTRRVDVVSDASTPGYEITAEIEDEVIVFARLVDEEVVSDLCRVVVGPGGSYDRVRRDLGEGTAPSEGYTQADRAGLTYDQWRTGRLVFGVIGLSFMAFFAFRALRGRLAQRRTSAGG
jgi:hypothetical protein